MRAPSRSIRFSALAAILACASSGAAQPAPGKTPVLGSAGEEALSDDAELARIVSLVEAAKYEECVSRLERLLDEKGTRPLTDREVIETARVYHATCLIGLGKPELAAEPLRAAIRKNPQMRAPDSLVFPARVIELFLRVREELYAELQAAQQAAIEKARREAAEKQKRESDEWAKMLLLERLARQEVVVIRNQRWIAAVPFGVGQFQNGNHGLGWVFLGAEVALGATALTALAVHTSLETKVSDILNRGGTAAPNVNERLRDWHLALTLSSYGFVSVAALGIAEAQISFVPEFRRVRERPLPKELLPQQSLSIVPDLRASGQGFELGVRGTF